MYSFCRWLASFNLQYFVRLSKDDKSLMNLTLYDIFAIIKKTWTNFTNSQNKKKAKFLLLIPGTFSTLTKEEPPEPKSNSSKSQKQSRGGRCCLSFLLVHTTGGSAPPHNTLGSRPSFLRPPPLSPSCSLHPPGLNPKSDFEGSPESRVSQQRKGQWFFFLCFFSANLRSGSSSSASPRPSALAEVLLHGCYSVRRPFPGAIASFLRTLHDSKMEHCTNFFE